MIGLESDYPEYGAVWNTAEVIFTVIFAVEALLKIFIRRLEYFLDSWDRLDLAIVLLAILDLVVQRDLQTLVVFRVLRIVSHNLKDFVT